MKKIDILVLILAVLTIMIWSYDLWRSNNILHHNTVTATEEMKRFECLTENKIMSANEFFQQQNSNSSIGISILQ